MGKDDTIDLICNIAELSSLFEKRTNVEGFLQQTVEMVSAHMKADVCSVYLYDARLKKLVLRATTGEHRGAIGKITLDLGEGITGLALKELRAIREDRGRDNPSFKVVPELHEEQYQAFLAVPIKRAITRIGALVVKHRKAGYFSETDTKALRAIASQLAATLENAELLMELHQELPSPMAAGETAFGKYIRGSSLSGGIAIGEAVVLGERSGEVFLTAPEHLAAMCSEDFGSALEATRDQLERLQLEMEQKYADVASLIFSSHLLILGDDDFSGRMIRRADEGASPLRAVVDVVNEYIHLFSGSSNPRLREKAQDVKDLGHRLIRNLTCSSDEHGDYDGQIVVARGLLPSELVRMAVQNAEGVILSGGGVTAHVSILARSLGIPVIMVDNLSRFSIEDDMSLVLDGYQGVVYLDPEEEVYRRYRDLREAERAAERERFAVKEETRTRDGERVRLLSNVNLLSDIRTAVQLKAEGIGLYRSEFPFIIRNDFPSEEEQYQVYRRIIEEMSGKEVIFRTLDIGGDKLLSYVPDIAEVNPFMGLRGIRFSLQNMEIFRDQLRAMLRAGEDSRLRIMFPLISSMDEFIAGRQELLHCIAELRREGIPCNRDPEVGAMIELPSAVESVRELAQAADFLSIGTNDLIQYLLGVDRTNDQVSQLYTHYHPAVLRAVDRIAAASREFGCDLSVCGDAASDLRMLPFFLGVGIRKLSVEPLRIPGVQARIETLTVPEVEAAARSILALGTVREVREFLGVGEPER